MSTISFGDHVQSYDTGVKRIVKKMNGDVLSCNVFDLKSNDYDKPLGRVLIYSVINGDREASKLFIESGADTGYNYGETSFLEHAAKHWYNNELIRDYLSNHRYSVNTEGCIAENVDGRNHNEIVENITYQNFDECLEMTRAIEAACEAKSVENITYQNFDECLEMTRAIEALYSLRSKKNGNLVGMLHREKQGNNIRILIEDVMKNIGDRKFSECVSVISDEARQCVKKYALQQHFIHEIQKELNHQNYDENVEHISLSSTGDHIFLRKLDGSTYECEVVDLRSDLPEYYSEVGADVLQKAIFGGDTHVAKLLIENHVDIYRVHSASMRVLSYLSFSNLNKGLIEVYLAREQDTARDCRGINDASIEDNSPLFDECHELTYAISIACASHQEDNIKVLISHAVHNVRNLAECVNFSFVESNEKLFNLLKQLGHSDEMKIEFDVCVESHIAIQHYLSEVKKGQNFIQGQNFIRPTYDQFNIDEGDSDNYKGSENSKSYKSSRSDGIAGVADNLNFRFDELAEFADGGDAVNVFDLML